MLDSTIANVGEGTIHRRNILGFLQISAKYLGLKEQPTHVSKDESKNRDSSAATDRGFSAVHDADYNPATAHAMRQKYEPVA